MKRGPDGKFSDDDLADILHTATENPACAFRGRGTPGVLRLIEILGIEQSRAWGLCTMNEFRTFLGLKRLFLSPVMSFLLGLLGLAEFLTFEEWNPDPEIAVRRVIYSQGLFCDSWLSRVLRVVYMGMSTI